MKRSNSISVSNEAGFTLLEILIAISILALISLAVVDITENAAQTKERTTEVNENNLQIETAMSRFEWDLSQIYSPMYFSAPLNSNVVQIFDPSRDNPPDTAGANAAGSAQGGAPAQPNPYLQQYYEQLAQRFERNEHFMGVSKEGNPIPRFYAPEKNVFEFFTSSNRRKLENQKQSHFAWVRYALANQEQTEEEEKNTNIPKSLKSFVRYYSADDPYSDKRLNIEDVERVKGAVLLRNVESLEFQYWDFQRRKWETSLRTIQNGETLIRGVRILLSWYDSFGNKRTASRIFRTHWPMVTPQDDQTAAAQAGTPGTNGQPADGDGDNDGVPDGP